MLYSRLGCFILAMTLAMISAADPAAPAPALDSKPTDSKASGPGPVNSTGKALTGTDPTGASCTCPPPATKTPENTSEKSPTEESVKPPADENPTSDACPSYINFGQNQQFYVGVGFLVALSSIYL